MAGPYKDPWFTLRNKLCALTPTGCTDEENNEAVGLGSKHHPAVYSWWVCHWFSTEQTPPQLLRNKEMCFQLLHRSTDTVIIKRQHVAVLYRFVGQTKMYLIDKTE